MAQAAGARLDMASLLTETERLAQQAALDLARMRIEKWKAGGDQKEQAQATSDSVQRNLTAALPSVIGQVRAAPNDLLPAFRLYRNLGALYDVMSNLAESAGAFGPKTEYEALAQHVGRLDELRRELANGIEAQALQRDMEMARARQGPPSSTARTGAKKIIVDDAAPAKPRRKKKQ